MQVTLQDENGTVYDSIAELASKKMARLSLPTFAAPGSFVVTTSAIPMPEFVGDNGDMVSHLSSRTKIQVLSSFVAIFFT